MREDMIEDGDKQNEKKKKRKTFKRGAILSRTTNSELSQPTQLMDSGLQWMGKKK